MPEASAIPFAGWSDGPHPPLAARAQRYLSRHVGAPAPAAAALGAAAVAEALGPGDLAPAIRDALVAVVGAAHVHVDGDSRVRHAGGASYTDLVRRRAGEVAGAPDAVLTPATHDEVAAVLRVCSAQQVAVVPFGGGTSVVGGVEPLRGGRRALITLDLRRLDRLTRVDRAALTAAFEPGVRGARAEALLAGHGLTLGHFPQSFERATLGGFVATRSAGQASAGYGRIDDLVVGLRVATPAGDLRLGRGPASGAGPDLLRLFVGSEGALGVITEVTVQVRPAPAQQLFDAWLAPDFPSGVDLTRELSQAAGRPDLVRLSDEPETAATLAMSGPGGLFGRLSRRYLKVRGFTPGCLLILGFDGDPGDVGDRQRAARARLRGAGCLHLGRRPAQAWRRERFAGPYLRDRLLDAGYLVETLETAAFWPDLLDLRRGVRRAIGDALTGSAGSPQVTCHLSHPYVTGASLYFTVLASRQAGDEVGQWQRAKQAASEVIVAAGATITHHHAVGTEHRSYLEAEIGALGVTALRALKATFDPAGVLNPGKLLPDCPGGGIVSS